MKDFDGTLKMKKRNDYDATISSVSLSNEMHIEEWKYRRKSGDCRLSRIIMPLIRIS